MNCPFAENDVITWVDDVPSHWHWSVTPGPMKVVGMWWHSGKPSEYAKLFGENGMNITPGWIITVEYDADLTTHYNPPLSFFFGKIIRRDIHQKWLRRI